MGIYREQHTRYTDENSQRYTEVYRQPAWRHWTSRALNAISYRTAPWERRLEGPLEWLHERRCHNDCGGVMTGYTIKPEYRDPIERAKVPVFRPKDDPDQKYWVKFERTGCARMPFPASVDVFLFHFGRRDRVALGEEPGESTPRTHPGPHGGPDISISENTSKRMRSW